MPSSYTSSLRLTLPATGENSGTWGTLVNSGVTDLIDASIAGYVSVAMTDADYTLTVANGLTDQARRMLLNMTGTLGAARLVICPTASKLYVIKNSTTGGFAITLKTSAGTGISIPNGKTMLLMCNGTDVVDAANHFSSATLATPLLPASGGTGIASLGTGVATWLGTPSSANLAAAVTDETGSGALVFGTSPTITSASMVTPALGTPTSGNFSTGTFTWPTFNQNTTGTAAGLSATLVATSGGTGQSSYAIGDILYASTTTALSKLADVATGNSLISGGVGVAPSWGKIGLTTHVSGTLPVANGGTGITSFGTGIATWLGTPSSANLAAAVTDETGSGALVFGTSPTITSASLVTPALGTPVSGNFSTGTFTWPTFNQNTTGTAAGLSATLVATSGGTGQSSYAVGDLLYASTTTALSKLADVATGNSLISGGVGVAPSWGKIGLTTHVSGTLALGNGGTGGTTAATARTGIGATTVGANFFTLTNPSAITFPRINADNTVSALDAATFRTAIGAGTSSASGTVTSVALSGGTTGITTSGGPITTSGTITLAGTLAVANGGTGVTTTPTNGQLLIGNGTGYTVASLTAGSNIVITPAAGGITIASTATSGTVTSVAVSGGTTGLTTSGGPITGSGTITFAGTLAATNGGTGQTSYAIGDLLYASTTTAVSKLADVATGNALISGGVGVAPSYGKIGLTTHVTGTLPIANGGTGAASAPGAVTALGGTTVGANFFTLPNPTAITFPRINADNTVSALDAATFRTAIGAGTSSATVTSVGLALPVSVFTISGSPVTTSGTLTATFSSQLANTVFAGPNGAAGTPTFRSLVAADVPTLNQNTTGTAANVTGIVAVANGGTGASTAAGGRSGLGATTVGANFFTLANPTAITFPQINADNTVSTLTAASFRTAIGAGTSSTTGTVTSVGGTGTISGLTLSGTVTTTGNLTLGGTLSVLPANFASQTAKTFLAAPNGAAGTPTFRVIVAADVPTLNQNTTGSSGSCTGNAATATSATSATTATNQSGGTVAATTLSASSTVSGTGFTNRFAAPGPIGSTTASTGAFTTLSASSTVSGTGFSTYLASPPAIGGTAPAAITGTTIKATALRETQAAIGASNLDLATGNFFSKTIAATTTLTVSNVPASGTVQSIVLDLTNGGAFAVTWWTGVKWGSGVAPYLTVSGRDVLGFFTYDGGTTWTGLVLARDVK